MSNQEVTYSNSRVFGSSSEAQNPAIPEETRGPQEVGHKVPLAVLCLLLMMAISVWLVYIFQYRQEKHNQEKIINNLYQKYYSIKNDSYLKEQNFNNKSTECDALKDRLNSVNREWKTCYGETKIVLDCIQRTGKHVEGHWFCCGKKCYYFIMDNKRWHGCKQTCRDCSLSLLKIEDDDELIFLKSQLHPKSYWIGLSYDRKEKEWEWIDDGPSKLDLTWLKSVHDTGDCAFLNSKGVHDEDCGKTHGCICEKRVEKFPGSVCIVRSELAVQVE
ncbi:killer cell lectin-like receptor 2 [Mesocricetus auratus]|uniref:Killer cell lectin-like receptor 2 n=1 Tax=Mesocricetus auratus TaxID=10036 RepID=A0A3Q0CAM7_MESAU|nr:killer cell lectin-like receptor 2 [Mesocricetus auratus]